MFALHFPSFWSLCQILQCRCLVSRFVSLGTYFLVNLNRSVDFGCARRCVTHIGLLCRLVWLFGVLMFDQNCLCPKQVQHHYTSMHAVIIRLFWSPEWYPTFTPRFVNFWNSVWTDGPARTPRSRPRPRPTWDGTGEPWSCSRLWLWCSVSRGCLWLSSTSWPIFNTRYGVSWDRCPLETQEIRQRTLTAGGQSITVCLNPHLTDIFDAESRNDVRVFTPLPPSEIR